MNMLRILFIGKSGSFSILPLMAVAKKYNVVGIVESAAKDINEKNVIRNKIYRLFHRIKQFRDLKWFAKKFNAQYFLLTKNNVSEMETFIVKQKPDICCVASMSQLLRKSTLTIPPYGCINVHPSLLPKYRGPTPLFWTYYFMDIEGGVTVHYLDEGEDTGDIIKQESFPIQLGEDPSRVMHKASQLGAELLVHSLDEIVAGTAKPKIQRHLPCPHRARRIKPEENLIDWQAWSIERVYHVLKGGRSWHKALKPPALLFCFEWGVKEIDRQLNSKPPGSIQLDRQGFYAAHPEGKIRLRLAFSPSRVISSIKKIIKYVA
ncbi:MAG: hypothetical protein FJ135_12425 [Deltaproteobacteria bacterium]|nr:hypothetical protein [Deltaproteobacteria bacterium]